MKVKKEYLILLLAIVLLVLYLTMRPDDQSSMDLPQPGAVERAKINRILITKEGAPLELVKKDDQWSIQPQGYPADMVQVNNMLNAIAKLTLTALVSESGNYERYALAPAAKMTVQAFADNAKVRDMDIGQVAPTFQHTFVKLEKDPNVYHARGAFKNTFDQTADSLRDKSVLDFDRELMTSLTIQRGEQKATLTQKEAPLPEKEKKEADAKAAPPAKKQWQDEQGKPVQQAAVDQLISAMAHLQCEAYINDTPKEAYKNPLWVVTVATGDKSHELFVFAKAKKEDSTFPALSSTSPYVFMLSSGQVESFEKQIGALLPTETKP